MNDNKYLFEEAPIRKAVLALIAPTIVSQLITVAYNMADTFFIGQIGDPNQVAAASICMPLFVILTGFANLFGVGGASLVSRSLGEKNYSKAKNVSAFSIVSAGSLALLYGILLFIFRETILPLVGANESIYTYCCQYAFWTITIGAAPTVLSAALAHLVRSEGYSKQAGFGIAMGGVLNMILDPIFISLFKLNIAGAAIATMLSNLAAALYYIVFILKKKDSMVISLNPKYYSLKQNIPSDVLLVGLPSSIMNVMGVFSNITMNRLMVAYCNEAVAGIGIAKKVDLLTYAVSMGMSQGVIPLIAYNYSAKDYKRMMSAVKTSFTMIIGVSAGCSILLFTCAGPVVRAFIDDPLTVSYGHLFQKIICVTGVCVGLTMNIITLFQSVGKKVQPLILSMLRKGSTDIVFMFLMNKLIGVNGIAWATPMSDFIDMLVAICLFIPFWKKLGNIMKEN